MRLLTNFHLLIANCKLPILFILAVFACTAKNETKPLKFQQYYNQGEQLYLIHCSNCHQKNGRGLGLVFPPIDTSDYMDKNLEQVICLIRNGKAGELIVNGKKYNQPMKGIYTLTDLEIAEIATYIYNTWSHNRGLIDVQQATKVLSACSATTLNK